jgi:putative molybdopterin biosynthesis protein
VHLLLVERELGLAFRQRASVRAVPDVLGLRLASRPPTAGIRAHLDRALLAVGADPADVHARALLLSSHRDVALALVRREADVGLCSKAWAARAGLAFLGLTTESYGLLLFASDLGDARIARLGEHAQSRAYRDALSAVPRYHAHSTGQLRYAAAG